MPSNSKRPQWAFSPFLKSVDVITGRLHKIHKKLLVLSPKRTVFRSEHLYTGHLHSAAPCSAYRTLYLMILILMTLVSYAIQDSENVCNGLKNNGTTTLLTVQRLVQLAYTLLVHFRLSCNTSKHFITWNNIIIRFLVCFEYCLATFGTASPAGSCFSTLKLSFMFISISSDKTLFPAEQGFLKVLYWHSVIHEWFRI